MVAGHLHLLCSWHRGELLLLCPIRCHLVVRGHVRDELVFWLLSSSYTSIMVVDNPPLVFSFPLPSSFFRHNFYSSILKLSASFWGTLTPLTLEIAPDPLNDFALVGVVMGEVGPPNRVSCTYQGDAWEIFGGEQMFLPILIRLAPELGEP